VHFFAGLSQAAQALLPTWQAGMEGLVGSPVVSSFLAEAAPAGLGRDKGCTGGRERWVPLVGGGGGRVPGGWREALA